MPQRAVTKEIADAAVGEAAQIEYHILGQKRIHHVSVHIIGESSGPAFAEITITDTSRNHSTSYGHGNVSTIGPNAIAATTFVRMNYLSPKSEREMILVFIINNTGDSHLFKLNVNYEEIEVPGND